jgi:glycosyltransferase involved in cell wall biosynthesis
MSSGELPVVVNMISSPFYGGPERQIVGTARALAPDYHVICGTFPDGGKSRAFTDAAAATGVPTFTLGCDNPHFTRMVRELADVLRRERASLLCTHHYKADLVGRAAAWMAGIPCVSVSHGWTAENAKVRVYEQLDRMVLRVMDAVICVSEAQADKVRLAGVARQRVRTIRNAIDPALYGRPDSRARAGLEAYFARRPHRIVGAIGRLSPEKGFDVLLAAMSAIGHLHPELGVVIFGDGPLRADLQRQIDALGLSERVVLAGFTPDLSRITPAFDVFVLPSHTEGLPVVVLEAMASSVPIVATSVGGTPEAVGDDCGILVPRADPARLAAAIVQVLADENCRRAMGEAGRARVEAKFTFGLQAAAYREAFAQVCAPHARVPRRPATVP